MTMKIALLAALGLVLGLLGGGAAGIGIGVAWTEIVDTPQEASSTLVFFTLMPLGAVIGAVGGAVLFGVIAIGDGELHIEQRPLNERD
ncbi:hypothetical protein [Rhodopseudomonas palustris]